MSGSEFPKILPRKLGHRPSARYQPEQPATASKPAARSKDYLSFCRANPCCICGHGGANEAHHFSIQRGHGIGQKPSDFLTVPLCRACHQQWHDTGACAVGDHRQHERTMRERTVRVFVECQVMLLVKWLELDA